MTEINEKLARFVWPDATKVTPYTVSGSDYSHLWVANETEFFAAIPAFTESLDAQAKYLWPRLSAYQCAVLADTLGPLWWAKSEAAQASAQAIYKLLEGK